MAESTKTISSIEGLQNRLRTAEKILSKEKTGIGQVKMWSGSVMQALGRMFGLESTIAQTWHPKNIPGNVDAREELSRRTALLRDLLVSIESINEDVFSKRGNGRRVFIGHGGSPLWRELKDFLGDRLNLPYDEFNREAVAGFTTFERISEMLDEASFAFLVMTAEDQHQDDTMHARENVVHEVGLFQGRLGPKRAIVLFEEGCSEFSNIHGLSQIRFPKGNISAVFEEIRRVLEREGLIDE